MITLQIAALAIAVIYILHWFFKEDKLENFLVRYITISAASWTAEDISIRAYNAYHYNPSWDLFLGHVPMLVIVVWPLIIHSGWELASELFRDKRKYIPIAVAGIVWIDASLIETISIKAGLWSWNGTGLFGVPLIGIFGWAYFAFFSVLFIELKMKIKTLGWRIAFIFIGAVTCTHCLIIASWWLIFRWNYLSLNSTFLTVIAWTVSTVLTCALLKKRLWINFDKKILIMRMPPVLFFFILYLIGRPNGLHTSYLTAFTLPYMVLLFKLSREEANQKLS